MAVTVRLKDAEVEAMEEAFSLMESTLVGTKRWAKLERVVGELRLKIARIREFGTLKKRSTGIPARDAITIFKGVLGSRLALPPNPDSTWWAIQQRGLNAAGFTKEHLVTIAETAARKWTGTIKVDSLFRQAVGLLAESAEPATMTSGRPSVAPLGMEKV